MHHQNSLELTRSALVVIDMQEGFRAKIEDFSATAARIALLVQAARLLNLPILVTEQYPKGLGHTAHEILTVLPDPFQTIEKTTFSSCGANQFQSQLEQTSARHVLVCGIEAHICVNQTAHDLLARGFKVHVVEDCITSRDPGNKQTALAKMRTSGAIPSSVEMALFELMRDARHEQFRAIQGLIK